MYMNYVTWISLIRNSGIKLIKIIPPDFKHFSQEEKHSTVISLLKFNKFIHNFSFNNLWLNLEALQNCNIMWNYSFFTRKLIKISYITNH